MNQLTRQQIITFCLLAHKFIYEELWKGKFLGRDIKPEFELSTYNQYPERFYIVEKQWFQREVKNPKPVISVEVYYKLPHESEWEDVDIQRGEKENDELISTLPITLQDIILGIETFKQKLLNEE